jgi:hypothetical protein
LARVILTILVYLGIASVGAYFSGLSAWITRVPQDWFLWFGVIVMFLLLLNAAVQFHQRVEDYETQQIDIIYNPPPEGISSFHQVYSYQRPNGQTVLEAEVFRVAIVNRSGHAIENVRVLLTAFMPQGAAQLPYTLQLMADERPFQESREGFRLDRGEIPTRYVEVVKKVYVNVVGLPPRQIVLQHVEPNTPNLIPDNRYELNLIATAGGNVPQTPPKVFVTFVDEQGRLHFEEEVRRP